MNPQLKKGVLELCVLCALQNSDRYGFELVSVVSSHIAMSGGTIYPLLKRLYSEGLVSTYLVESQEGPARKYYALTPKGEDYTKTLIEQWRELVSGVESIINEGGRNDETI